MLGYVASQLVKIVCIHNVINDSGSNDIMFHLLSQKQIRNCSKEAVTITQNVLNEVITADEAFTCVRQPAGFLQKRLRGLNLIGSGGVTPCINKSCPLLLMLHHQTQVNWNWKTQQ